MATGPGFRVMGDKMWPGVWGSFKVPAIPGQRVVRPGGRFSVLSSSI